MNLLTELLKLKRLGSPSDDNNENESTRSRHRHHHSHDTEDDDPDDASRPSKPTLSFSDYANGLTDENSSEDSFDFQSDDQSNQEDQTDPNRAGVIRRVKGAHLVYKREQSDGTYEEMWIYNSGSFNLDLKTKKAIIAGTDIPENDTQSPDGTQNVIMWSAGNCDVLVITGLPQ